MKPKSHPLLVKADGFFVIAKLFKEKVGVKTTGSAGGPKRLSLCPANLSERSEEPRSLLLREKGDHGSGG